jgi:large subunit ribosomal protein L31e
MVEKTEKLYIIPLRRTVIKTERINRSKVAAKTIRSYLIRHFKVEDTRISRGINELLWSRGAKKPPGKIKVKIEIKDKTAFARLPDEKEEVKTEKKPKGRMEAMREKLKQPGAVQKVVDTAVERAKTDVKAENAEEKKQM